MPHRRINDGDYILAWLKVLPGGACSDAMNAVAEGKMMITTHWLAADVCALPEDVNELIERKRLEERWGLPPETDD